MKPAAGAARSACLLTALALTLGSAGPALGATPAEFWVAPGGSDRNPGTREKPLATVAMGWRHAREWRRRNAASDGAAARIILRGGVYPLNRPLLIRHEDSGTETGPTVMESAPGEQAVLSGGIPIEKWRKANATVPGLPVAARGHVWFAEVPKQAGRAIAFRQLWVNGRKATRARQPNGGTLDRLLGWDRRHEIAWIPTSALSALRRPAQAEMVIEQQWEIAVCRLDSLRVEGMRTGLTFRQPEGRIEFEHPWPQPVLSTNGNAAFFLANAIEFLDAPGEWYEDLARGRVYYWPRNDENMAGARAIVPALETLIKVEGTPDHAVAHLQFKGIEFAYTTWLRPSEAGHVPLQAGMFLLDAYKLSPKGTAYHRGLDNLAWIGRPPGAVRVQNANHLRFERCRFEHLASAGLDFTSGTHDDRIEGCLFRDIGGNGIQIGRFSAPGVETHLPYLPADGREVCAREQILNNVVTDCGNEDWGCVGICVGYGRDITIGHNELSNLPYTGVSVGWGWTRATNCMSHNRIIANRIHHVATRLCDTAGIYTLSAQPGTLITGNSVYDIRMSPYVFDPEHWFYLYLDEGSSFITVTNNWCPAQKFLKNANGPGNVWRDNGPGVSTKIKNDAGLQPAFRNLYPASRETGE